MIWQGLQSNQPLCSDLYLIEKATKVIRRQAGRPGERADLDLVEDDHIIWESRW